MHALTCFYGVHESNWDVRFGSLGVLENIQLFPVEDYAEAQT